MVRRISCVLLGLLLIIAWAPAVSQAAPVASINAFTVDPDGLRFTDANSTLTFKGSKGQIMLTAQPASGDPWFFIAGLNDRSAEFTAGTTYTFTAGDTNNTGSLAVEHDATCDSEYGSLVIDAVTYNPTGGMTKLAASYDDNCDGAPAFAGQLRYHSTLDYLDLGKTDIGTTSAVGTVTIPGNDATFGQARITGADASMFAITADTCSHHTVTGTCTVSLTSFPTEHGGRFVHLEIPNGASTVVVPVAVDGFIGVYGSYYPIPQSRRILDTRTGTGAPKQALGAQKTLSLKVTNLSGVTPPDGISAVVLNLTVTAPTALGYLSMYPHGGARPTVSSINFARGATIANLVTVPVGAGGLVDIYNASGSVQVIADLVGFYGASDSLIGTYASGVGDQYQVSQPTRVLDTRKSGDGPLPGGYEVSLGVTYDSTIDPHLRALAVNVTAIGGSAGGYLKTWDQDEGGLPPTSTVNFGAHQIVPNATIVPVGLSSGTPTFSIYNGSSQPAHILIDVVGFFDDGQLTHGLRFRPLPPIRIVDTRRPLGTTQFGPASEHMVTAPSSVADDPTYALVTNTTAINPSTATFVTLWPNYSDEPRPIVSSLNPAAHQTVAAGGINELGPGNVLNIYNAGGTLDLALDVSGSFEYYPGTSPSGPAAAGLQAHSVYARTQLAPSEHGTNRVSP